MNTKTRSRLFYVVDHGYPYSSDGYAVRTHGIAKGLSDWGCDLLVASLKVHEKAGLVTKSLKWESHVVDEVNYINLGNSKCMQYESLAEIVEMHRADAIMAASDWRNALPAEKAARNLGLPFFMTSVDFGKSLKQLETLIGKTLRLSKMKWLEKWR